MNSPREFKFVVSLGFGAPTGWVESSFIHFSMGRVGSGRIYRKYNINSSTQIKIVITELRFPDYIEESNILIL